MNFLVHHQCFKNKKATESAIKSFREYNNNPYVLWSDSGDDFSNIASENNIDYFYSTINVGYRHYNKDKAFELVERIRKSCELYPNLPYIMWMEDDVLVRGEIKIPLGTEFCGGPDVGNRYLGDVFEYICKKYNLNPNFNYYCTAGGTIMSSDIFSEKFHILEKFLEEDYEIITENMWTEFSHHDIILMTINLLCGKKYSINPHHVELNRNSNWRSEQFTIVHGYKENY